MYIGAAITRRLNQVGFKMKRIIDTVAQTVTFTFGEDVAPLVFHADRASEANQRYAQMHGWSARLGDTAAIVRKQKDGTVVDVTEAMRRAEIARLADHYESGAEAWDVGARPSFNPMVQELAAALGTDYATAKIKFDEQVRAQFAAMIAAAKAE